jgi:hypothetical protein
MLKPVLHVVSCRFGLGWFLMVYLWCNGPLVGEKRGRGTDIRASHMTHDA